MSKKWKDEQHLAERSAKEVSLKSQKSTARKSHGIKHT